MFAKYTNFSLFQNQHLDLRRNIALILIALLPLLLVISKISATISLVIIDILFIIHCFKKKSNPIIIEPISIICGLLWIWFLIISLFSPFNSLESFFISFFYVRFIIFFFACIYWLLIDLKELKIIIGVMTIILLLIASDSLLQFFSGFSISGREQLAGRLTSFLRRPDIGIYMAKLLFPISALWIRNSMNSNKVLDLLPPYLFLFFITTVIFLTGERTATILTLFSISLILLIIGLTHQYLRYYIISLMILIFLLLTSYIYNSSFLYSRLLNSISDISNIGDSLYGQLFQASFFSWIKYSIFMGVGIRQFRYSCLDFIESQQVTYCDLHSHNIYLELLSETGIIGLILFCIFVFLCLKEIIIAAFSIYKKNINLFASTICLLGSIIVILFPISATMSFISNWSATLNWLGISLCIAINRIKK